MYYDDIEITARVWESHSDLYSLTEEGDLDESYDIIINNDDMEIVWYEVGEMTHLHCTDKDGTLLYFVEIPSVEEAKRRIDLYHKQNPIEE